MILADVNIFEDVVRKREGMDRKFRSTKKGKEQGSKRIYFSINAPYNLLPEDKG